MARHSDDEYLSAIAHTRSTRASIPGAGPVATGRGR